MEIEIVIVILLVVVVALFLWEMLRERQRWKEQSDGLSKSVGERIDGTIAVFGELKEKLGELAQRTRDIQEAGKDISNLHAILRAPKFRGGLGELLLERLLADILPCENYSLQHRFKSGEMVDAVIRIGGNLVPIDSKFPLEDFERILSSESEKEQESLRKQFARTMRNHIDHVTKYILPDESTFDFALMYIPAENVYYEVILRGRAEDKEIYSYALQKRVIPVSPNSLYAYLQVIIQGLKGLRIESAAREIQGHLGRLQGDLADFQGDYATLGIHLGHAARKYDEAERKLARLGDRLQLAGGAVIEKLPQNNKEPGDS